MADDSSTHQRDYSFVLTPGYEMDLVAKNSGSLNRLFQDAYTVGLGPLISNDTARHWVGEGWAVFWTYMFIIWPHEAGHWVRGKQGTGEFIFHNAALPFPHTTVELADDATLEDEIVISVGGFEINSLMARQTAQDFYVNRYGYTDTMVNGFVHKIFFPLYSFVVFPADPTKEDTWVNTRGDPVHFVLPTYERFTGRSPVRDDGAVDEDLIGLYREATYLSLLWNLIDPFFYQSAAAFGDNAKMTPFSAKPWLLGDFGLGWMYGTLFNPSPLGYELYLNNYIYVSNQLYVLSLKHGRPFKNNAVALNVPMLFRRQRVSVGADAEVWDQDIYGVGGAIGATVDYAYSRHLVFSVNANWKDRGYQLGKRLERSSAVYFGIDYRL